MIWTPRVITLDVRFGTDERWSTWRGPAWPAIVRDALEALRAIGAVT